MSGWHARLITYLRTGWWLLELDRMGKMESRSSARGLAVLIPMLAFAFGVMVTAPAARAEESAGAAAEATATARISASIRMLSATSTGAEILARARTLWGVDPQEWLDSGKIREGRVSRTDATLTRSWDAATGREIRERDVVVNLKLGQPLQEVSLDLAHELTHAVAQPAWDPYDPELRAENYVRNAIDGVGGEVDAILRECLAAFELERRGGVPISRCDRYRRDYEAAGTIPRGRVSRDFYASGETFERIPKDVRERVPEITKEAPIYFSSTGDSPYPISLVREYEALTEIACSNTRSRLLRQAGALRAPAVEGAADSPLARARMFLEKRCR